MTNHNIEFKNLVRQLVPFHKLQTNRLIWLNALLKPLREMFGEFVKYRAELRMVARVTSQVKVFEGYLRAKYSEPIGIKIVTYDDEALDVCLDGESSQGVDISLLIEGIETVETPMSFEIRDKFGDTDFIVYTPKSIDIDSVRADVERFKKVLVKYKIEQK